jgi:hypothetical protein
MKKLFYLLLTIIVSITYLNCGKQGLEMQKSVYIYGYDFTPYSEKGFLFTPEGYQGEYESVGIITVEIWPNINRDSGVVYKPGQFYSPGTVRYYYYEPISPTEVLDSLYTKSISMGANAVINLIIKEEQIEKSGYLIPIEMASGFAIKRINK